jgi:hypothetical protein
MGERTMQTRDIGVKGVLSANHCQTVNSSKVYFISVR